MARQSTTPVSFFRTVREDTGILMTSGRAGVVVPIGYIPLLAGDSCGGRCGIDLDLAEMPKPLLNAVHANFQAWFVPKSAHPQFPGRDELMHARTGAKIKALGALDRDPPPFFTLLGVSQRAQAASSTFFTTLGIHIDLGQNVNTDLIDAFNLIYNFRLSSHSSKLQRRPYASENLAEALTLPPAFWPSSRLSRVVPDYERSLIVGSFDMDIGAGQIIYTGEVPVAINPTNVGTQRVKRRATGETVGSNSPTLDVGPTGILRGRVGSNAEVVDSYLDPGTSLRALVGNLRGAFAGDQVSVTLADIDKARTTQAFANLRTAYAGNDATGFDNDDTIVAHLMQGLPVPPDQFKRPWLLDSKRVPVGFSERFATDAANLDASVTQGRASAVLGLNVPVQDVSGVIIITVELLPERIDERMADDWVQAANPEQLPNALRDIQRTEPVDHVFNRRVDAKHAEPGSIYGFEPMNDKWNRKFTRLGGVFYSPTPGAGYAESRANIWQSEIINPLLTLNHYIAPFPFPHDVFSDTTAPAFEVVCRHAVKINGLTQIGDVLVEDTGDFEAVEEA